MNSERRPAHRPSRVDQVVGAGIRVFARKGLAGATMAEVAEECGMGPGALYYHFATKEQLFAECVRSVADDVANITGHGGAPPGSLPEVVRLIYDWYAACPDKARLFFLAAPGSTPEIAQTWAEFVEEHVRDLARYVQGPADDSERWIGSRLVMSSSMIESKTAIRWAQAAGGSPSPQSSPK